MSTQSANLYVQLFQKHDATPWQGCYINEMDTGECRASAVGIRLIELLGGRSEALRLIGRIPQMAIYMILADDFELHDELFWRGVDNGWEDKRDFNLMPTDTPETSYSKGYREGSEARLLLHPKSWM